ncbi:sensor histidine kinase KdpD [Sediminibacterium sp.]|uniref:sensor histidine kinase n=1 Tax=Sediminibacterium sp. TaxID=1917865 RepID=UPI0027349885|nr:HAMP domain-containing sensor histidine kinase [Sediminibacterium sp.]MDP3394888.1 HAMP domain-containing sensor histidine kinase [Sediminibacterium sp.]MDP3565514.1 HAMP domain-containing sensor histidine kinase [Sediminibacterium sp.]
MTKPKSNILFQILSLGNQDDTPFRVAYKNYMFNLFLLLATPFAFLVTCINLYIGAYTLAFFNVAHLLIFVVGYYISYSQKHLDYRPLLLFIGAVISSYTAYMFKNGNEYRFLIMIVAAVVLCEKNWQYILFVLFVSLSFVVIRLDELPLSTMNGLNIFEKVIKLLFPLSFFSICLYYFKEFYFKNQYKLETAYAELTKNKEERDRILNVVAHDLRSPLSGISGISKMMLADDKVVEDNKEMFRLIEQSAESTLRLITDLMHTNINSAEQYQFQEIELNKLVQQILQILVFTAKEKNIIIEVNIAKQKLILNADKDKIDRVISNLVTNAIKFSKPGSIVHVSLHTNDGFAEITVKDNGIGIPEYLQGKIFDLFTTAKRKGTAGEKSYGLGLAICKKIVEVHEGFIHVESKEGIGSSFIVRLPLKA